MWTAEEIERARQGLSPEKQRELDLLLTGGRIDCETSPSWFHDSQNRTWESSKPITCICAGWQAGKTVGLPFWLKREIQRRGPGDYGAFSSTYKLLARKFLPELKKCFCSGKKDDCDLAIFRVVDQQIVFTDEGNRKIHGPDWDGEPTVIQLGHAENPDSLESATLKAVVWDECGQRLVPKASFDTVVSRLMVNRGRLLLASKPYEANWFKDLVTTPSDNVQVITYASWENPENPSEDDPYWIPIRAAMPAWKFQMFYVGIFTMPAGLIYDCFNRTDHVCTDFQVLRAHPNATVHPGMDFGKVNTAGVAAVDDRSTGTIYIIGNYHAGKKREYTEHIASMRELTVPCANGRDYSVGCGGNKHGEDGWREAYRMHGLALEEPPENNIDVQIQNVWTLISTGKLKFFAAGAAEVIEEIEAYSREVDEDGEVTDKILDDAKFHRLAALRYICMKLRPNLAGRSTVAAAGNTPVTMPNIARTPGIAIAGNNMAQRAGNPFLKVR